MKTGFLLTVSIVISVVASSTVMPTTEGSQEVSNKFWFLSRVKIDITTISPIEVKEEHAEIRRGLPFLLKMITVRYPTLRELCTHLRCSSSCLRRKYKNGGFCDSAACRCLK